MPDYSDRRAHIDALLRAALLAADPAEAVRRAWRPADLDGARRVFLAGAGKGGVGMGLAAAGLIGERLAGGVIAVPNLPPAAPPGLRFIQGGHPQPDAGSLAAGKALVDLLIGQNEDDLVVVVLSGGGSALLERFAPGLDLARLQTLTSALMRAGAAIDVLNRVRKHLSQIKGGGLARLAAPARVVALILSDVVGDPLDVIASGPTAPDPTTTAQARAILERYAPLALLAGLADCLHETPKPGDPLFQRVTNRLVGSNRLAREAAGEAARTLGFTVEMPETALQGEARERGRELIERVRAAPAGVRPRALILGGETTVTVKGHGIGGRNHELALAAALALEGEKRRIVLASVGTDGLDGQAPSAGAWGAPDTCTRARAAGLDPRASLADNDSYTFFEALGDCFHTGPTGTNVNDLVIILEYS